MDANKLLILQTVIVLAVLFSCSEGDTNPELAKLPPATSIGANTCGCLLNGKAWIATIPEQDTTKVYSIGQFTSWSAIPFSSGDTLSIHSRGWSEPRALGVEHDVRRSNGWAYLVTSFGNYHSSASSNGALSITFSKYDLDNMIMSGTFYMKIYPPDSLKDLQPVLEFTHCRFDFKFWHP